MGIIIDLVRNRDKSDPYALTPTELEAYHIYKDELLADGFVSPIMLPSDRIKSLRGSLSIADMADKCHMTPRDLQILMDNPHIEPNPRQLTSIALAYDVSVFWLLGYHTDGNRIGSADREIMQAISSRNDAEASMHRLKDTGFLREVIAQIIQNRINKRTMEVARIAAHITAREHCPLTEEQIYLLEGQPVFIEYANETTGWGIACSNGIVTANEHLHITDLGSSFSAFLTPQFLSR